MTDAKFTTSSMTDAELDKACESMKREAWAMDAIAQIIGSPWKESLALTLNSFEYVVIGLKGHGIDDTLLACELTRIAIENGRSFQVSTTASL